MGIISTIATAVLEKLAETWIGSLLTSFLGGGKAKAAAPTPEARAATAEIQLAQQETANAIVTQDAAVRTDADARVLHELQQPAPEGSAGAGGSARTALDADPAGHWRD